MSYDRRQSHHQHHQHSSQPPNLPLPHPTVDPHTGNPIELTERQRLENNIKLLELHTRAYTTQLTSAEEFYFNDCTHGNILRGWENNFATIPSLHSSHHSHHHNNKQQKHITEQQRVFSLSSAPVYHDPQTYTIPHPADGPSIYQNIPTIIVPSDSATAAAAQQGINPNIHPSGPIKRPLG